VPPAERAAQSLRDRCGMTSAGGFATPCAAPPACRRERPGMPCSAVPTPAARRAGRARRGGEGSARSLDRRDC